MPELPEVETIVRQLAPLVRGQRVRVLELLDPLLGAPPVQLLRGRIITQVFRAGKQVVLALGPEESPLWLAVHLRMTGRLIWHESGPVTEQRHLRARLELSAGTVLFYDFRRFGTITIHTAREQLQVGGVDPLSRAFTLAALAALLRRDRQELKPWLMRQDRLVGIGNIYASEILFEARLHPNRRAAALTPTEIARLHSATRRILQRAIRHSGTTFSAYQTVEGQRGAFQRLLRVYGREGEPCRVCGRPVRRIVQQQRSTFFCAHCQRRTAS